jgi:hypothetical protein
MQEGVLLCKGGMAKKKHHQENSDPGKVWTMKGVHRRQNKDVQKWHGTRDAVMRDRWLNKDDGRIRPEINLQVEPEKDGRLGRDVGWIWKAALV